MSANERAAPVITPAAARNSTAKPSASNLALLQGGKQQAVIPPGWEWLHRLREGGLAPERSFVRVTLDCDRFDAADALPIPEGSIAGLDFSPLAGLDVFLIFRATVSRFGRLHRCCEALLASGAESLRLVDMDSRHFVATLKVGHEGVGRFTAARGAQ